MIHSFHIADELQVDFKKLEVGAGGLAQWLKTCVAFAGHGFNLMDLPKEDTKKQ